MDYFKQKPTDDPALLAAVRAFAKQHAAIPFDVSVEAVEGPAARFKLSDPQGAVGPAWGFAVREGAAWRGLALGTAFDSAFYAKHHIPKGVQL